LFDFRPCEVSVIISAEPSSLVQFEFCVEETQRFADLYGIKSDLEAAIRYCDLHIEIDPTQRGIPTEEISRREHTRQALCRAALVMYGRAWGWGSGKRSGLGEEYIAQLSVAARDLHAVVKPLRDKWVAHAVNHFEDARVQIDVGVTSAGKAEVRGVSIVTHSVGGFVQAWMIQFRNLISEVLSNVQAEIRRESDRLSALVKQMPIADVLQRTRVDGVPLQRAGLDPTKQRRKFRS